MDQGAFDRLTQRVSRAGSRRQALRAVLGAALAGATTTHAAAAVRRAPKSRGREHCVRMRTALLLLLLQRIRARRRGAVGEGFVLLGNALQLQRRVLQQPVLLGRPG